MRLEEHPSVEWVREDMPKKRVKRDYVVEDDDARVKRQLPRPALPIPKLPFIDPLYEGLFIKDIKFDE
jgi:hypothetical protein